MEATSLPVRHMSNQILISLKTFEFLQKPVTYHITSSLSTNNESTELSSKEKSTILNVLDTSRPPGQPRYWFHSPGALGSFQWTRIRHFGRGLDNFANICFLNATIQCLTYCTPFAEDCLASRHSNRCIRRAKKQVCGFCYFEQHVQNLLKPADNKKTPAHWPPGLLQLMKKEIRMNEGNWYGAQNCAHEWLVQFLEFLTKYDLPPELQRDFECGRINSTELGTCYLHQLFSGEFQERKTCKVCEKSSIRYELNSCIRVQLNNSKKLQDALKATFDLEELTGSNRPMCENCGVVRDKRSSRLITQAPNVLIVLLQRAEFKAVGSFNGKGHHRYLPHIQKNSARIEVPITLSLTEFISPDARPDSRESNLFYDFFGSVNHAGSAGFGHYWAIVKGPDGMYHKVDDERYHMIPASSLTEQLSSAYLIFYLRRRTEPITTITTGQQSVTLYSTTANKQSVTCGPDKSDFVSANSQGLRLCVGLDIPNKHLTPTIRNKTSNSNLNSSGSLPESQHQTQQQAWLCNLKETDSYNNLNKDDGKSLKTDRTLTSSMPDTSTPVGKRGTLKPLLAKVHRFKALREIHTRNDKADGLCLNSLNTSPNINSANLTKIHSKRLALTVKFSRVLSKRNFIGKSNFRKRLNSMSGQCITTARSKRAHINKSDLNSTKKTRQYWQMSKRNDRFTSDDFGKAPESSLDVATSCPNLKKQRVRTKDIEPELRIKQASSLQSQYGCIKPIETWENGAACENLQHRVAAFEAIQRLLVPNSSQRSHHDKQYDIGKTKKVKGMTQLEEMSSQKKFNFGKAAETLKKRVFWKNKPKRMVKHGKKKRRSLHDLHR